MEAIRARGLELYGMTPRLQELVGRFKGIDSAKTTTNLWGRPLRARPQHL